MCGVKAVRKYPDGYFIVNLSSGQQAHFFLEVDQGTMTNALWQEKVRAEPILNFGRAVARKSILTLAIIGCWGSPPASAG